jgi:hypothetical protein
MLAIISAGGDLGSGDFAPIDNEELLLAEATPSTHNLQKPQSLQAEVGSADGEEFFSVIEDTGMEDAFPAIEDEAPVDPDAFSAIKDETPFNPDRNSDIMDAEPFSAIEGEENADVFPVIDDGDLDGLPGAVDKTEPNDHPHTPVAPPSKPEKKIGRLPPSWMHGTAAEQAARAENLREVLEEMEQIEAQIQPATVPAGIDPKCETYRVCYDLCLRLQIMIPLIGSHF